MGLKDKIGKYRRKSSIRIILLIILLIGLGILFYTKQKLRIWIVGLMIIVLTALGMEISGNDWDLGTGNKIEKTDNGTWIFGKECTKNKLNCANFEFQEDAQDLFEKCGGTENDINGLDKDKDGEVCEHLPNKN